jgi:hypothetical protein
MAPQPPSSPLLSTHPVTGSKGPRPFAGPGSTRPCLLLTFDIRQQCGEQADQR